MPKTYVIGVHPDTNESYIVMDRWGHHVTEERIAVAFETGEIWSDRVYFLAHIELSTDDIEADHPAPKMCTICARRPVADQGGTQTTAGELCYECMEPPTWVCRHGNPLGDCAGCVTERGQDNAV